MHKDAKTFVAGHRGPVGSVILRQLRANGHTAIVTRTREQTDLTETLVTSVTDGQGAKLST